MDDDVKILPESIIKTYNLLRCLKPEYRDHFISGAMLYYEKMHVQHEDVALSVKMEPMDQENHPWKCIWQLLFY